MEHETRVQRALRRFEALKLDKEPFIPRFELINEYVLARRNFRRQLGDTGQFITGSVYDATAPLSKNKMASSMVGALYPNSAKTFQLKPASSLRGRETEQVRQYYDQFTKRTGRFMDMPKAGLAVSLYEHMNVQSGLGTSGIHVIDTQLYKSPVSYRTVDCRSSYIAEGADGYVDTIYTMHHMTIRQVVQEYKIENVSEQTREAYEKGRFDDKIEVLHLIEPRTEIDHTAMGNRGMPFISLHIEVKAQKELRESGFREMPIPISRFLKEPDEVYGRSPASEALPEILEVNAIREGTIIAIEKALDPPLALYNDGSLGGGVVDTSAGALNVFNVSGRLSQGQQRIIEALVTTGELNSSYNRILEIQKVIENHFYIDRLLDLNNDTEMTASETNIRNKLRGESLGGIYGRQIVELLNPLIERTVSILLVNGHLGVIEGSEEHYRALMFGDDPLIIPDEVVHAMINGHEVYEIDYNSPAARIMKQEELQGISNTTDFAAKLATVDPNAGLFINTEDTLRMVQELTGAPANMIRSLEKVKQIQEQQAQQQQAMLEMQMQSENAKSMKDMGLAAQAASNAGLGA